MKILQHKEKNCIFKYTRKLQSRSFFKYTFRQVHASVLLKLALRVLTDSQQERESESDEFHDSGLEWKEITQLFSGNVTHTVLHHKTHEFAFFKSTYPMIPFQIRLNPPKNPFN